MKLAALALAVSALATVRPASAADALAAAPQANIACVELLAEAPRSPAFPEEAYQAKLGATIRLEMEFVDARREPRVRVLPPLGAEPPAVFGEAARAFVRHYRNTCMKDGDPPVRVRQEFVFVPNDGRKVVWTIASVLGEGRADSMVAGCVRHLAPGTLPAFPRSAARDGKSGRVVIQAEFKALNEPPVVKVLAAGPRSDFAASATSFAEGYRLTCGEVPVIAVQRFNFNLQGNAHYVLKDTNLQSFVAASRNAADKPVFFDLNSMGCPFEVRMEYWQPFFRNRVGEIGESRPERRALLDWLSGLKLNLKPSQEADFASEALTIAIPCGKIDL
ncbi:hypothetical protein [Ramlibacter sp. PS4R-6]|uniref:hypothetical protein n=1 Tax=Ramlibacter sp. PS4R-6 TaxID=3133438 RepID=UPI0030A70D24